VPGLMVTSFRKRLCSGVLALLLGVAGAEVCVFGLRGGVVTKGSLFSTSSRRVWVVVASVGRVILGRCVTCQ
jgi:hypothetical protein